MRRQVKAAEVRRELLPEQSPELLRELHLLTREGDLNADALRKLKQVNHLVGLLRPALEDVFAHYSSLSQSGRLRETAQTRRIARRLG